MRHGISTHGSASYYVVGLMDCLLKGIDTPLQALFGYAYKSAVLTALSVPVVVAVMWYVVRRWTKIRFGCEPVSKINSANRVGRICGLSGWTKNDHHLPQWAGSRSVQQQRSSCAGWPKWTLSVGPSDIVLCSTATPLTVWIFIVLIPRRAALLGRREAAFNVRA